MWDSAKTVSICIEVLKQESIKKDKVLKIFDLQKCEQKTPAENESNIVAQKDWLYVPSHWGDFSDTMFALFIVWVLI